MADENETEWVSNLGGSARSLSTRDHPCLDRPRPVPSPAPTPWGPCCPRRSATTWPPGSPGRSCSPSTDPDRLVSVGFATDVFDAPFTGIDDGEIDHGQYDVVRDVAAVGGASMLVRRDLLRGLTAPTRCSPRRRRPSTFASGPGSGRTGRGVPSSEVLVPEATHRWREDAGEIRAMLKVYSPLTLLWALPVRFLLGLLEPIAAPFLGRWTLFGWVKAWGWNLVRLALDRPGHGCRRG